MVSWHNEAMKAGLPHLLIVDDDKRLRSLIQKFLADKGFVTVSATDAYDAENILEHLELDLIILDVMMPGKQGTEFLADLRKTSQIPVLMLTALGDSADRIKGLELGADDYLAKPFEPKELLLRINSILRRQPAQVASKLVKFGNFSFNPENSSLQNNGGAIYLTSAEEVLLALLAANGNKAVSREEISKVSKDITDDRAVDVQIMRLRKKIEDDLKRPIYIQTVRGEGYRLNVS